MSELLEDKQIPIQFKIKCFKEIAEYLNSKGILWFPMCGVLLGFIRKGTFIEWDSDIDLGIINFFDRIDENELALLGYDIKRNNNSPWYKQLQIYKKGLGIDLFEMKETKKYYVFHFAPNSTLYRSISKKLIGDNKTHSDFIVPYNTKRRIALTSLQIPRYHLFPKKGFVIEKYFGIPIYIPYNAEAWLMLLYGYTWFIPNDNYSTSKDRQINRKRRKL